MRFLDFCELFRSIGFPRAEDITHPEHAAVYEIKTRLKDAIGDAEFLADAFALELARISDASIAIRGLDPFYIVPEFGVRFAFGHWSPHSGIEPHEHTAWTITGICRNELEILTYDYRESYQRKELVYRNHFREQEGRVGLVHEPTIHAPKNVSSHWSLSIHITSPLDGKRPIGFPEPLPALYSGKSFSPTEAEHPYSHVEGARQRVRLVDHLAYQIQSITGPDVDDLLMRCYEMGSFITQRRIQGAKQQDASRQPLTHPWVLARTHKDLVLRSRQVGGIACLDAETPTGFVQELTATSHAHKAFEFVAHQDTFDVAAIPGIIDNRDRFSIAAWLEDAGLYKTVEV
jgi:hypothetical protein